MEREFEDIVDHHGWIALVKLRARHSYVVLINLKLS
jgi:hypothetical protein